MRLPRKWLNPPPEGGAFRRMRACLAASPDWVCIGENISGGGVGEKKGVHRDDNKKKRKKTEGENVPKDNQGDRIVDYVIRYENERWC